MVGHAHPMATGGGRQYQVRMLVPGMMDGNSFGAWQCDTRGRVSPISCCSVIGGGGRRSDADASCSWCIDAPLEVFLWDVRAATTAVTAG